SVHDGIFGSDNVIAVWAQDFLRGGDIKVPRYLNKSVGSLFRRIELLLLWLRRRSGLLFWLGRRLGGQNEQEAINDCASNHEEFRRSHNICFRFHLFFLIECLSPSAASTTTPAAMTTAATTAAATASVTAASSAATHSATPH